MDIHEAPRRNSLHDWSIWGDSQNQRFPRSSFSQGSQASFQGSFQPSLQGSNQGWSFQGTHSSLDPLAPNVLSPPAPPPPPQLSSLPPPQASFGLEPSHSGWYSYTSESVPRMSPQCRPLDLGPDLLSRHSIDWRPEWVAADLRPPPDWKPDWKPPARLAPGLQSFYPGLWGDSIWSSRAHDPLDADHAAIEASLRRHSYGDVYTGRPSGVSSAGSAGSAGGTGPFGQVHLRSRSSAVAPTATPTAAQAPFSTAASILGAPTATGVAGSARRASVSAAISEPRRRHSDGTDRMVEEYFSADPHKRVKVTKEYLERRFFDEERYLGESYQLPKFPVESQMNECDLVLVAFKAGRIDVFYLPVTPELAAVTIGDVVLVEADRGRDLGKIVKMKVSIDEARVLKLLQFLEQQAALTDNASTNELSVKTLHTTDGHSPEHHRGCGGPPTLHFPKAIIGLAHEHDLAQIINKKQDEEKACRLCLAKIASTTSSLGNGNTSTGETSLTSSDLMQMKLVDAEYQFDRKKLIFYYSTSRRIDFRDLVRELFRIYKTRIWMCAVKGIPYVAPSKKMLPRRGSKSRERNDEGQTRSPAHGGDATETMVLRSLVETLDT